MKTKALVCILVFIVAELVGAGVFAADKEKYGIYIPNPNEEIYGTWVNMNYSGEFNFPQKFVLYNWGYFEVYMITIVKKPSFMGTGTPVDKWTDSDGNIWYKGYGRGNWDGKVWFEIDKISKNGTVWEYIDGINDFPTEADLDQKNPGYHIYYRQ